MALAAIAAAVLTGCGSAQPSSGERTRLTSEVAAQLRTLGVPPDVAACVTEQSRGLPLASLRQVAQLTSSPVPTGEFEGLVTTCFQQGKGVAEFRAGLVQMLSQASLSGMPPALRTCSVARVNATTPSELARMIFGSSRKQVATNTSQFADRILAQCAVAPQVLTPLLAPIERGKYSPAFKACAVQKLKAGWPEIVHTLLFDPTADAGSSGTALAQRTATECEASGAIP